MNRPATSPAPTNGKSAVRVAPCARVVARSFVRSVRSKATCAAFFGAVALSPAIANAQPELSFSADQVEGDIRMRELVLRGNVVVSYERFRLTSPSLSLQRTARGIEVRGPGEVVFCPCPNPPVSIGFAGGIVAPPADLILEK
ncbi:MAG: hypothetical protein ABW133_14855, partial [Polyangiaceae bacterium]